MKNIMVFHIGGNLRYLRKIKNDFVEHSKQQSLYMKKHLDHDFISPRLTKEQLQQMMQVVEAIRLNYHK